MRPIGVNRAHPVYNMIVRRSPKEDRVVDPTTEAIDETLRQITALEKDVCYAELNNRPPEVVVTLEARLRTLRSQLAVLEAVNPERSF